MNWFLVVVSAGLVGGSSSIGPMSEKACRIEMSHFRSARCEERPSARCAILGSPDAGGVYDDKGNCVVPYRFTRPDGVITVSPSCSLNISPGRGILPVGECSKKQIDQMLGQRKD